MGQRVTNPFKMVPIIEVVENDERLGVIENVITLIDEMDKALSEKSNDVDYFADAYMKVLGALLTKEQLEKLRDTRIINLKSKESEDDTPENLDVDFLSKPNADTTQENLINRIDDKTIRVKISREELAERGVSVLDMLKDRSKIQDFFYSILSEIDEDHSFANDSPVSFQVMPNRDGLDLLISKVDADNPNVLKAFGLDQDTDSDVDMEFADLTESAPAKAESQTKADDSTNDRQAYSFTDLGMVVELADSLKVSDLATSLYFFKGKYYLEAAFLNDIYAEIKPEDTWAITNEYGLKVNDGEFSTAKRLGKCIMRQDALGNLRYYFDR